MHPDAYPVQHERLQKCWRSFVETGLIDERDRAFLDPVVWRSWLRCLPRLDAKGTPRPKRLSRASLASVLKAQQSLISVAAPLMEDIHQFIEGSDSAIVLTDASSCILSVCGDDPALKLVEKYGLGRGSYWTEGQLGTTALATVHDAAVPTQVVGAEHFFRVYHRFVSTAAPIHDVRGRIVGLLGIVGPVETANSHTLGLAMTAARAVGNQLQTDWYVEEANRHLSEVRTMLGAISEGVIAWDEDGIINHVNEPTRDILDINPASILGRPLQDVVGLPPTLEQAVERVRELREVEVTLRVNGKSASCMASLQHVLDGARSIGCILTLRPIEQVRRLVHQQIGVRASLTLDDISSQAPSMRPVLRQARIAARGTAPVLLRGEGGVGKNHLARAIHNGGLRADGPFIAINCQAIPHELMISEFLGHDRLEDPKSRPSKFELANEGTLLLDQIEHLSLEMQAAVLQLIETGHVIRLGSAKPIPVDVRIVAATTADLEERVHEGSFISHLFYRFGVFNIRLVPLRERPEDIPLLAERFLARIVLRSDQPAWIDDDAMAMLRRYPWPGNVRELESVLERAISHSRDGTIRVGDLPQSVREGRVITDDSPRPRRVISISEAEREAIVRAGWACGGQVTAMAQQLGIGRTTLWRKMKHYGLEAENFKD